MQGIDVHRDTLWLSSVDAQRKRGLLFLFDRKTGEMKRSVEVHTGDRFHPGGLSLEGDSLWVPVAEYRRSSTTNMQRRHARTLALESSFTVNDHVGAVAVVKEGIAGANWDAREFYVWTRDGKQLRKVANPTGIAIQDMKFINGTLIAGGLQKDGTGAVVWLQWPSLNILRKMQTGKTDRGVAFTHEGLAIAAGNLYLVPEDTPSRLFTFQLPRAWR